MFISFFFHQPKQKKLPIAPVVNPNPKKCGKQVDTPVQDVTSDNDFIVPEPDPTEQDMLELIDLVAADNQTDDGRVTEVNEKVSAFHIQAVEDARKLGVQISAEEASVTLGLFPKVTRLALCLHNSPTLQSRFARVITDGQITALIHCVTTWWNTNFDCFQSHITQECEIVALIMMEASLKKYLLTREQWELA